MPEEATILELAEQIHVAMDQLSRALGEDGYPPWASCPDWQREASVASARKALTQPLTPGEEHARWMAEKRAAGWVWGPTKDADARTHPMLVPFTELPITEQVKDAVPWLVAMRFRDPGSEDG